jgi:hypothetical protein
MKFTRSSVVALAVALAFACNGRLKVGKNAAGPSLAAGEGGEPGEAAAGAENGGSSSRSGGQGGGGQGGGGQGGGGRGGGGAGGRPAGAGGVVTAATSGAPGTAGSAVGGGGAGNGGTAAAAAGAGTGGLDYFPCPDFQTTCGTGGVTDEEDDYWESLPRTPPVPGSSDGCPEGPQTPDSACETPGLTCGYRFGDDTMYQECGCALRPGGDAVWRCEGGGGDTQNSCPLEQPVENADCFGFYSSFCPYPWKIECTCFEQYGVWQCVEPFGTPDDAPRPMLPDPEKAVADLSDAERELLCDWSSTMFAGGEGYVPTPDYPVNDEGYVTGAGCSFGDYNFCPASAPAISIAQCIANLELSECEAPVKTLAECVLNVFYECTPAHTACSEYLGSPNCSGTMVRSGISTAACELRVE